MEKNFVYLASASPRRLALLAQIGVVCRQHPVAVDEQGVPDEPPSAYVGRLAQLKAHTAWIELDRPPAAIVAADTAVVLGDQVLGKPADRAEAMSMLTRLSGREHRVLTGVTVRRGAQSHTRISNTLVEFRSLSHSERRAYWDSEELQDKAGAYAIQGRAAMFVRRIDGSYSGVMGLPLFETAELLNGHGHTLLPER